MTRYWLIDGLATAFSGLRTAEQVRFYFPKAAQIEPLTEAEYWCEEPEEHYRTQELRHLAAA